MGKENRDPKKKTLLKRLPATQDILLSVIGAILCGLGCGFVNYASWGMDSVGLFYDGIRNILNLSPDQIGYASYVVCFLLSLFLWFAARKYVSIGSIIYIVVYGAFANFGTSFWEWVNPDGGRAVDLLIAFLGLLILYVGLAIYITIDIGVDAFTGVVLWICDVTHKKMPVVKILFDLGLVLLGFLMGGTIGYLTPVTILIGGPCISFLQKRFMRIYFRETVEEESKNRSQQN